MYRYSNLFSNLILVSRGGGGGGGGALVAEEEPGCLHTTAQVPLSMVLQQEPRPFTQGRGFIGE